MNLSLYLLLLSIYLVEINSYYKYYQSNIVYNRQKLQESQIIENIEISSHLSILHEKIASSNSSIAYATLLNYNPIDSNGNRHNATEFTMLLLIDVICKVMHIKINENINKSIFISQDMNWPLINNVFYHMRTNYSLIPTLTIWDSVIQATAKKGYWIESKKFLLKQQKYGQIYNQPSLQSFNRLFR